MAEDSEQTGSSPYSTGGGGGQLEQEYAAAVLASLLLAQPVEGLGDEFAPSHVSLQQEAHSPVDDVVVHGVSAGSERELRVACRHRPRLGRSDQSTVKLFADYVQVVLDEAAAIEAGLVRLGLAVAGPYGPAAEVAVLTEIARRQPSRASFAAAVIAPGAYAASVRRRLRLIDELVEAALNFLHGSGNVHELSWALLRGLFVIQTQLEGDAAPGRTNIVARLQVLTGNTARAEALRLRLVDIASQSAIRAGAFTRAMLRRELRPFGPLGASPDFVAAQSQIALLESELRQRTQRSLPGSGATPAFSLDRSLLETDLLRRISDAPAGSVVLVRGEPDVGKSALALAVIDSIRASGGAALAMSLRDLPPAVVQLKDALGLGPIELLAAAPSAPVSVLLLDGAEVIQEHEAGALGALLDAAATVGMTTVLVARDDAVSAVSNVLQARGINQPNEFPVATLADEEIHLLVQAIPELARLAADPRAVWLLRRLGLVELLLRAANRGGGLPETLSSEAQIFDSVWSALVRQNERSIAGTTPDERDAALIGVARHLLTGMPAAATVGAALMSLRSDGILASRTQSATWQAADSFVSDVVRDFATARLLIRDGLQVLTQSSAPRWAIRATRLYAQARLADAAVRPAGSITARWLDLRAAFAELARSHGARWAELPWEALLTAGWADRALAELSPQLAGDGVLRAEAVRCINLRFTQGGACDPLVGAPLVTWFVSNGLPAPVQYDDPDPITGLVLPWLRGVARAELGGQDVTTFRSLRERIRDELLREGPEGRLREWLECLALMGSASNDATASALRAIAKKSPHRLAPVVESLDAAMSLAAQDAALLADLTRAYYIEEPSVAWWMGAIDTEGIRDHEPGGWGIPLAAYYRGPFLPLLRADFVRGLEVIDRMLDRGARCRCDVSARRGGERGAAQDGDESYEGVYLDLFGSGRRFFVGDAHVWRWYRGAGVGPYPCMSALFCLEIVLDQLVRAGATPRAAAARVLRNATTLATPGLVFGFLARHLEKINDELDGFLAVPEVWRMEFIRALDEGSLHAQGTDRVELTGRERRRWTAREVVWQLVVGAAQRGDEAALERLRGVGQQLIGAGGGDGAPPEVRLWAAHLDWQSYTIRSEGDHFVVELNPPADVMEALAPAHAKSANDAQMYRLLHRYRLQTITPYRVALPERPTEGELANDYVTARALEAEGDRAERALDLLRSAIAGVAAALLDGVLGGLTVPSESLPWALSLLVDCATNPFIDEFAGASSVSPDGVDRKAALALPLALLLTFRRPHASEAFPSLGEAAQDLQAALTAGTTSLFVEVRQDAAEGLRGIVGKPCAEAIDGQCWHELIWAAIEAGARNVVLAPRWEQGRRPIESLAEDLVAGLASRPVEDLLLTHIAPAAICALDAARSETCISSRAARARDALLRVYSRAACHWAENLYDWRDEQHAAFAAAVLRSAADATPTLIVDIAKQLVVSPAALGDYLRALTSAATYEVGLVAPLAVAWPQVMELGLAGLHETASQRDWYQIEALLRNLVPAPHPSAYVGDVDAILKVARANWLGLEAVSAYMDEWLRHARGHDWCVDALVGFLQAQELEQQATVGLKWVRSLVVDDDGTARTSGFALVGWLGRLRDHDTLNSISWPDYRAIVDALVLSSFSGARDLQQRDE